MSEPGDLLTNAGFHTAPWNDRYASRSSTEAHTPDMARSGLSAVEQFAATVAAGAPVLQTRYWRLMPATPPGPGQQYAFDVDLDRCSGCKSCVTACHALNGLDEEEAWRDVGLLVGGTPQLPVLQHVTAACHHCLQPACLGACPVDAYEKDAVTGIVIHLDDQCIGCRYCTLACPYDVPKYHSALGIVRKCDLCRHRLSRSEPPACVQACPHQAISIRVVDIAEVMETTETDALVPGAPSSHVTLPTTVYRSLRSFPSNMRPADYYRVRPGDAHWPLVIMLVLTQMAAGSWWIGLWLAAMGTWIDAANTQAWHATCAVVVAIAALVASIAHLGRPWLCWRAVIGLRHSWLSREIVAFGLFAALAISYGVFWWFQPPPASSASSCAWQWLGWLAAGASAGGVVCSAMVYAATKRACWSESATVGRFLLSACLLGLAATWLFWELNPMLRRSSEPPLLDEQRYWFSRALLVVTTAKLLWELAVFRHLLGKPRTALRRTAELHVTQLANATYARWALGFVGGIALPTLVCGTALLDELGALRWIASVAITVAVTGGEVLERYLFFAAAVAPRMPGGVDA